MDDFQAAESLGLTLPSPAYLFGLILFGVIGFAAYRFGKKTSRGNIKWIGIALMLYPYVIADTWLLYAIGSGLCAAMYFLRE